VKRYLAVDPGDVHVGWCYGTLDGWETGEWRPGEATNAVVYFMTMDLIDELVIEEFVLYEREYSNQTWSPLKTSQLIGALKLIAHWFRVPVKEQGAYIKKPTRAQMKARGVRQQGDGTHARDAELHLYYRAYREQREALQDG
jgi:hypothetical protein